MDFGKYGNTWWCKKWLEGLFRSCDDQTVIQGMRFVERGQVTSIDIIDNRVISVVKGPNGGLHNNYIVFPKFHDEKIGVFINLLKQQPSEMLALENGAMNPPTELLLAKSGINLFDSSDDVKMGCDCRDPVPCKYIAATFLKIAEMAGSDPSLLFKLHGLDLAHYKNSPAIQSDLDAPYEKSLVRTSGIKNKIFEEKVDNSLDFAEDASASLFANSPQNVSRTPPQRLPVFNYDEWKDYSRILPAMLQNFPSFCTAGNFRKSYTDELEGCRKFFLNYENFDVFAEHFRANNAKTFLMEKESLRLFHKDGWRWYFEQSGENGNVIKSGLNVSSVMGALCCLDKGNLSWHSYSVRYLLQLLNVAFHLVRTGAIYPQVFWIGKDVAQMRWMPAEMLPDILGIVADIEAAVPPHFAFTAKEDEFVEIAEPAEHVLSLFISQLLRFAHTYKPALKTNHGNLLSFFFNCVSGKLANSAHAIPGKIQKWFSVYSSLDFRTQLLFKCYETGEQVALEVFVFDADKLTPLSTLFEENDARLLSILNILNGIADSFKPMGAYIENRAASPIMMQGAVLLEFLQDCLKKLEIFGIKTEIPKNLLNVGKPKPKMRLQGSMSFGAFTANDLLDFDWEIAIGDENVSAEEFLELAENADGLLKYKSQYVTVSEEDLKAIREKLEGKNASGSSGKEGAGKKGSNAGTESAAGNDGEISDAGKDGTGDESADDAPVITQAKLVQACFTGECDGVPVEMAGEFKQQFDAWRAETEVPLPKHLNATMRPYQVRGYSWMYKNLEIGFGCILADDMGLGKTLQVIAFLLKMHEEGKLAEKKALVVLPAGLLCNWQVEIKKFAPELTFFAYHGGSRDLEKFHADVLLTTYATFRKDFEELNERPWQAIVIDEAQNIKNADSEQSRLLRRMRAPMKIAMSGTPVENRLMEFWTIMDFANRGFFPSAAEFREKFETPIQKMGNEKVAETFRKITAPFMLRRLKTDKSIISDLPDKIIQDEYAELTKPQAALYQKTLEHFMQELEMEQALSEKANDAHALFKRKGIILQMILALKQICNHPATFLKGAAVAPQEKVAEASDSQAETAEATPAENVPATSAPALSSGKMQMLLDLLTSIQEQGEKTLIFTQFAEMGFLLEKTITEELGLRTHFYHGGCSQTQRSSMIEDFQKNPECKVLILSLKAGGTGLNLTAASQVIHYDLWWNPAIEAQATDRAFRIGQTRNVQVHRFITKGTFEEKINALLETKKSIANMTVSAGETWLADMDDKQLGEVFGLDNTLV